MHLTPLTLSLNSMQWIYKPSDLLTHLLINVSSHGCLHQIKTRQYSSFGHYRCLIAVLNFHSMCWIWYVLEVRQGGSNDVCSCPHWNQTRTNRYGCVVGAAENNIAYCEHKCWSRSHIDNIVVYVYRFFFLVLFSDNQLRYWMDEVRVAD